MSPRPEAAGAPAGRTAVLLQTTHPPAAAALWAALRAACGEAYDVWLLWDGTRGPWPGMTTAPGPVWTFTLDALWQRYRLQSYRPDGAPALIPGNFAWPVLDFMQTHPGYTRVWRIEDDVRYTGDWRVVFDAFAASPADLLGTTLFREPRRPAWPWWSSLVPPPGVRLAPRARIRGFFPVLGLSRRAMHHLLDAQQAGWRGHGEAVLPTVLHRLGRPIEDLGGDGEFVRPGHRNRFYTNTPDADGLWPGSFVYRRPPGAPPPSDPPPAAAGALLHHPVKAPIIDE